MLLKNKLWAKMLKRRKKEEGRRKKEEGRGKIFSTLPYPTLPLFPIPLSPTIPLSIGMANLLQSGGKVGVGNGSGFGPVNVSNTCGVEGCDRQTHRYSVVGVAINIRAS